MWGEEQTKLKLKAQVSQSLAIFQEEKDVYER